MDVKIIIDESAASPEVIIKAREITPDIQHVIDLLRGNHDRQLLGYNDREVFILDASKIFSIHTEGNKVTAVTEDGSFHLKNRLYEIDENPPNKFFIRISNSEIVNFNKVKSLDLSITGTITLKFKNGDKTYVSRRYVDKIKMHLGL